MLAAEEKTYKIRLMMNWIGLPPSAAEIVSATGVMKSETLTVASKTSKQSLTKPSVSTDLTPQLAAIFAVIVNTSCANKPSCKKKFHKFMATPTTLIPALLNPVIKAGRARSTPK